ncbi:MAG: hypothetical protein KDN19_18975, partial [Verrucomicrobiae bacterium]|nr:hypothetical protein [Verrucomicrobiae bacterium]
MFGWICIVVTPVEARDSFTIFKTLGSPVEGLSGVSTNGDIASVVGDDNAIYSLVYLTGNGVDSTNDQGIVRVAPGGPVELIARKGQKVGGKTILQINDPPVVDSAGNVLFQVYLPSSPFSRIAYIHGKAGKLKIIAGENRPGPGGVGTLTSLLFERMNAGGQLAFLGYTATPQAMV